MQAFRRFRCGDAGHCREQPQRGRPVGRSQGEVDGQRHVRLLAQRLHAAQGLQLAGGQDGKAVHALLQLGQDVRSDDDGHATRLQLAQCGVEVADGLRVQAVGGLVEQQHLGLAQQGLRKPQALAHALGVFAHGAVARVGQAHAFQQRGALCEGRTLEAGEETQRFQPVQVVVEHHVLGQVAQVAAGGAKVAALHRGAAHPDLARGGGREAQDHLEQRALARAVVADEAEDLAARDAQVDAVHGVQCAVVLVRAPHLDGGGLAQVNGGRVACHAENSVGVGSVACGALGPPRWARAAPETAGPPGAVPARPGWPAAA